MSVFNNEQVQKIINMYKDGIPIDEIINAFSTEEHFIREVLKENQIDRQYNKFADELNERLIYLYRDKKYVQSKICYDLLVSETGINKILKRNGVPKRKPSEYNQKYKRNSNYFDVIDTENKAYYLGLLYADGNNYTQKRHNIITLSLQEEDGYLVERFKEELKYEGLVHLDRFHDKNPKYKNQVRIVVNDEHMSKQLYNLGVVDCKSLILTFPDFLEEKYLRHFCRGYFDGDGCVFYDESRKRFVTSTAGTLEFVSGLRKIMNSFGCSAYLYHPKQSLDKNTYTLNTCGNNMGLKYLSWMYENCDIKMIRKYNTYLYGKEKHGNDGNLILCNE